MKGKKIIIGILALIVLIAAALIYLNYRNRSLSPPGSATLTSGGVTVNVSYSRPSVRDRLIFGPASKDAVVPYGEYWRLGANESTEITFSSNILFNGHPVLAGTYRMYAIPGENTFEIRLNSELGKWGAMEPDYDLDVVKTEIPVEKAVKPVEQYTISLAPSETGIYMIFEWSDLKFTVPIEIP